ncbi:MAG: hypothetical protein EXS32_08310 [Opitutus sp.]|nr:hypothetical protein [Opitutus sp.]
MVRLVRLHRLIAPLAAFALPAPLDAQPVSPLASPPTATAASPAAPAPSAAKRPRAISPEAAAALAATMPKYAPPPPRPPPTPEEDLPDLRETDKPRNAIIRLPKYIVQEPKSPIFRERDINTKQGLANIAMRRYLSEADRALNRFRLPLFGLSNAERALAMYAEDERLKNMADLADNTNMVMRSDPAAGAKVKEAAQNTYQRWSDFSYSRDRAK